MAKKEKWMQDAVPESHKGKFSRKAARAGMSTAEYARKEKDAPGTLGKEARLARVFAKERPKKRASKRSRRRA